MSPYQPAADLDEGQHAFFVRAIDKYGHSQGASRDFTVDVTPPETQIDSGPPATVGTATPTFAFSSNESSTFLCRFDQGNFFACEPPLVAPALANGPHTFEVAAVDAAGNLDQTPAAYAFTVSVPSPPVKTTVVGSLVLISGRTVKLVKGKLIPITLTCAGLRTCAGTVKVKTDKQVKTSSKGKKPRRRVLQLGSKKFSIPGNKRKKILVPVTKRKVKLLRRLKRVKIRATIRETDSNGKPRISTRTFMLRAR